MKGLLLLAAVAAGCGGPARPGDAAATPRHAEDATPRPAASPPDASPEASPELEQADGPGEEMRVEAPEKNPLSPTVKLKLVITPPARGTLVWGRKKMGELKPGQMTVEMERPRGSGPLDLVIRAEGFLPHHVRLFSDRDDKLYVRLYHPDDARGLLGYRP